MIFHQYVLGCLSQMSYFIGDETSGRAVVVDPRRDVGVYLAHATAAGMRIERVIETHCHADFLSGHLELAATGAVISYGEGAQIDYPVEFLRDGQILDLGRVRLEIRATPGHTPESICVVVYEDRDDTTPYGVLTGDTLFVGDVGRPDLLSAAGHSSADLAGQLYRSLHDKLMTLSDDTRVFPAHGAGSACGRAISAATVTTIGEQRRASHALSFTDEAEFIAAVTEGLSPPPPYFAFDARRNREARSLLDERSPLRRIAFSDLAAVDDVVVLDTREPQDYAAGHLAGSLNVGLAGRFAEHAGAVISPEQRIVLVTPPGRELEAKIRLGRIGFDNVVGFLVDTPTLVSRSCRLTAAQLRHHFDTSKPMTVIDVRNPGELSDGVIPGAVNVPLSRLTERIGDFDPARAVVVYCASGYRSMTAASALSAAGFSDVSDLLGGYAAWRSLHRSTKSKLSRGWWTRRR
jgi:glyoxylase-like metal-dependent hydrolase (beta-lactamase superfamily II)/rhodanese-related sulfurtransferase